MKRKLAIVVAVSMVVGIFAGCTNSKKTSSSGSTSGASGSTSSSADTKDEKDKGNEPIVIKAGHGLVETLPMGQGWEHFKSIVEEKTEGRITVEIYPNQMLGGDRELIEATQMGNIQMTAPSSTPYANFVPEYYLWDVPFIFETREQVVEFINNEEIANAFNEKSLEIGIRILGIWENGFRNVSCNGERVVPDDYKGLKIRTMENDLHMAAWKAIGANPTPMAFGELYTALQQKTVDAQENPLATIYETKYHEVQDHVIETKHIFTPFIVMINEAFYQGLSPEDQKIISEAVAETSEWEFNLAAEKEGSYRDSLNESITVTQITPEQRQLFVDKIEAANIKGMAIEKCGNPELAEKFFAVADEISGK